ncbi:hypothetical protein C206_10192 [Pseudomonas putida TRO1]|uniref:Uncharacterized protein n=2 Tax=Pseudomonas TaxID=286 RepID=A0AAD2WBN1_PSEPU|nr:hypothetical protein C206_10192 [Pseudomonas putida TRO1]OUS85494.1 hypothetical protein CBP05_06920 [Pseudomonas putida]OUS89793.1 hypothetical protein CBP06_05630 [Pseudomonas putida]PKF23925.1 hypothetical protein CW309_24865 [Pseudomonas hunanensis]PTV61771.1 hypothetical protein DBL05_05915 [Pseudomonas putida]
MEHSIFGGAHSRVPQPMVGGSIRVCAGFSESVQHWPQTTIQPSSEGRRGRPVRRKASNESMSGRVHRPARVIITACGLGVSGVSEGRIVAQGAIGSSRQNVAGSLSD